MLEDKCLKEIFRAQQVFSKRALKNIFEQLAQSSIMKLNRTAMDKVKITEIFCRTNLLTFFPSACFVCAWPCTTRTTYFYVCIFVACVACTQLYDLMIMAVKYQVCEHLLRLSQYADVF